LYTFPASLILATCPAHRDKNNKIRFLLLCVNLTAAGANCRDSTLKQIKIGGNSKKVENSHIIYSTAEGMQEKINFITILNVKSTGTNVSASQITR
jgi:hypothetical protein